MAWLGIATVMWQVPKLHVCAKPAANTPYIPLVTLIIGSTD